MRRVVTALFVAVALGCGSSTPDSDLVLPGTFSEDTTIDDLKARYGEANVVAGTLDDGEPGVTLFPDDPTRRAYVRFHGDQNDPTALLASITVTDEESRWRGKGGIRVGSSFAEVRKANGNAFYYWGFSDGRGTVRDTWDVGGLDVVEGDRLYFSVDLQAKPGTPANVLPNDEPSASSDDPRFPKVGELVEVSAIRAWSSLDDEWSRRSPASPVVAGRAPDREHGRVREERS